MDNDNQVVDVVDDDPDVEADNKNNHRAVEVDQEGAGGKEQEQEEEEEIMDPTIVEEFRVWKKNAPLLYDLVYTHALEWPSLTVQWTGKSTIETNSSSNNNSSPYIEHELLLGTQAEEGEENYLIFAKVRLPAPDTEIDARKYNEETGELGGYGGVEGKIELNFKVTHNGHVNRARMMPHQNFIVSTRANHGAVYVFDKTKHSSISKTSEFQPQLECVGLSGEGYGLDWNPHQECSTYLVSGDEHGKIATWNIEGLAKQFKQKLYTSLSPVHVYENTHEGGVGDTQWSRAHPSLFASVGNDGNVCVWDIRTSKQVSCTKAHNGDANCVAFAYNSEFLFATGGSDNIINIWDQRKMSKLHELSAGEPPSATSADGEDKLVKNEIYQVVWSPFSDNILSSCGSDRRALIWDISKIGEEQSEEDAADGPPELFFVHGGHTSVVTDFSWNPDEEWVVATVSEDNILQIWQPEESIVYEDDGEPVRDEDLE